MKHILVWVKASRLPSQSYIFLPLLLGQAAYYFNTHHIDLTTLFLVQTFGIFNQLYIIYANDYADRETDLKNTTFTIFSGGSRIIAEGKLKPQTIKNAAILMAIACFIISSITAVYTKTPILVALNFLALFLLYAYSYSPFILSYRGGGEFLQMLGVGIILPTYGYLAQTGSFANFPTELLPILLPMNLACAIATSLPDTPSDTISGKRTFAVLAGNSIAKTVLLILELVAYFFFIHYQQIYFPNSETNPYLYIPLLGIFGSLLGWKGKPGTVSISLFVFFSIFFALSIQILLILFFFYF